MKFKFLILWCAAALSLPISAESRQSEFFTKWPAGSSPTEVGKRVAENYLDKLQEANGLFFHGTDSKFYWGRGNGWMAAGSAELLSALPENHPRRARILAGYRKMMAGLLADQADTGMWRQLIDKPTSWPETSGTAMFTFAMVTGVKNGWLDEATYGPAARKAWLALVGYLDDKANLREICIGTNKGFTEKYYNNRRRMVGDLHGQSPMLWTACALMK